MILSKLQYVSYVESYSGKDLKNAFFLIWISRSILFAHVSNFAYLFYMI